MAWLIRRGWCSACLGPAAAVLTEATVRRLQDLDVALDVVCSDYGALMWHQETDERFADAVARWTKRGRVTVHRPQDVAAPISSGSYPTRGMAIVPCSMATVGALASGAGQNLLHRAADVTLKEKRRLVLVPRETPLSLIHLRNLTTLAEAGAVILPPDPRVLPASGLSRSNRGCAGGADSVCGGRDSKGGRGSRLDGLS